MDQATEYQKKLAEDLRGLATNSPARMQNAKPEVPLNPQEPTEKNRWQNKMAERGWFKSQGAYVLVDGQFGSTGKGLAEQVLADLFGHRVNFITTNAGPNSGHTIYHPSTGEKIVLKQIPSFMAQAAIMKLNIPCLLNSGAIVDPTILKSELDLVHGLLGCQPDVMIHQHAAAILPKHYQEQSSLSAIASTQKGTGPALSDKILRKRFGVAETVHDFEDLQVLRNAAVSRSGVTFVSTAQGFSLGINTGFYPYTTCRECTVQQALSDARIPARALRKVIATYRTLPIRVGDTAQGSSGGWYPDQKELSWEELNLEPETTTVTGRQRRIATWSWQQFTEGLVVNDPDALFINFLNYLSQEEARGLVAKAAKRFGETLGRQPDFVMLGFGPRLYDVKIAFDFQDAERYVQEFFGSRSVKAA